MKKFVESKFLVIITLFNLLQSVRITIQRPQSDDSSYQVLGEPFDNSNQYDDNLSTEEEITTNVTEEEETIFEPIEKRDAKTINDQKEYKEILPLQRERDLKRTKRSFSKLNEIVNDDTFPLLHFKSKRSSDDNEGDVNGGSVFFWNLDATRRKRSNIDNDGSKIEYTNILDRNDEIDSLNNRVPYVFYRFRRDTDTDTSIENDEVNTTESQYIFPNGVSVPLFQVKHFDKQTQINATLTNVSKPNVKSPLPIDDVLSLIRSKRWMDADDELQKDVHGSGSGALVKEVISDLDVAESSVVFKPLFRYRSQVSERRRIYNNYY